MDTLVLAIGPTLAPADAARLAARLRAVPRGHHPAVVVCDVAAVTEPDLGAVEALAGLQLTARRLGYRIRLRGASDRLRELLALTGLDGVLPLWIEPVGEPEEREEALGVEERVDPGDPAV
ncbi:STAS domain-containing protein [Streptomyces sp. NPDC059373]